LYVREKRGSNKYRGDRLRTELTVTGSASLPLWLLFIAAVRTFTIGFMVMVDFRIHTAAILPTLVRTLRRRAGTCLKCRPGSAEEQQKTQQDEKNSV